ncbi:hypothetical protein HK101_010109 [Irineochytrium annulatum]|nr:hypothetical protein HK101_010109 [Irineochytrium annulatum]
MSDWDDDDLDDLLGDSDDDVGFGKKKKPTPAPAASAKQDRTGSLGDGLDDHDAVKPFVLGGGGGGGKLGGALASTTTTDLLSLSMMDLNDAPAAASNEPKTGRRGSAAEPEVVTAPPVTQGNGGGSAPWMSNSFSAVPPATANPIASTTAPTVSRPGTSMSGMSDVLGGRGADSFGGTRTPSPARKPPASHARAASDGSDDGDLLDILGLGDKPATNPLAGSSPASRRGVGGVDGGGIATSAPAVNKFSLSGANFGSPSTDLKPKPSGGFGTSSFLGGGSVSNSNHSIGHASSTGGGGHKDHDEFVPSFLMESSGERRRRGPAPGASLSGPSPLSNAVAFSSAGSIGSGAGTGTATPAGRRAGGAGLGSAAGSVGGSNGGLSFLENSRAGVLGTSAGQQQGVKESGSTTGLSFLDNFDSTSGGSSRRSRPTSMAFSKSEITDDAPPVGQAVDGKQTGIGGLPFLDAKPKFLSKPEPKAEKSIQFADDDGKNASLESSSLQSLSPDSDEEEEEPPAPSKSSRPASASSSRKSSLRADTATRSSKGSKRRKDDEDVETLRMKVQALETLVDELEADLKKEKEAREDEEGKRKVAEEDSKRTVAEKMEAEAKAAEERARMIELHTDDRIKAEERLASETARLRESLEEEKIKVLRELRDSMREANRIDLDKLSVEHDRVLAELTAAHLEEMAKVISNAEATRHLETLADRMDVSSKIVDTMQQRIENDYMQSLRLQNHLITQRKEIDDDRIKLRAEIRDSESHLTEQRRRLEDERRLVDESRFSLEDQIVSMRSERDAATSALHRERLEFIKARESWVIERRRVEQGVADERRKLAMEKALLEVRRDAVSGLEEEANRMREREEAQTIADRTVLTQETHTVSIHKTELYRELAKAKAERLALEAARAKLVAERDAFDKMREAIEREVREVGGMHELTVKERERADAIFAETKRAVAEYNETKDSLKKEREDIEDQKQQMNELREQLTKERVAIAEQRSLSQVRMPRGKEYLDAPEHKMLFGANGADEPPLSVRSLSPQRLGPPFERPPVNQPNYLTSSALGPSQPTYLPTPTLAPSYLQPTWFGGGMVGAEAMAEPMASREEIDLAMAAGTKLSRMIAGLKNNKDSLSRQVEYLSSQRQHAWK